MDQDLIDKPQLPNGMTSRGVAKSDTGRVDNGRVLEIRQ